MTDVDDTQEAPAAPVDEWKVDKKGRAYIGRRDGRSGVIYRDGDESVDEARARDARGPKDRRPRKKSTAERIADVKPPPPRSVDLKAIEKELGKALQAPGMAFAMAGHEWPAEHCMTQGPILARNLCAAAEHDAWLRDKLVALLEGPEMFMRFMTLATLGGAVIGYAAPPLLYFFTQPGDGRMGKAREAFGVPERPQKAPTPAAAPTPDEVPDAARAAAAKAAQSTPGPTA